MSFEEFWCIYPRHIAKKTAKKAWDRALKDASEVDILDGAQRYAVERDGEDAKYTKHPATWLNGGCWTDDPGANTPHQKSYAELADDLRRQRQNGAGSSEDSGDLFGPSFTGPGDHRHR
jgi:hypothetical protein